MDESSASRYYRSGELVPSDLLGVLERAKIVITNFHAFMLRETLELSKGGRTLLPTALEALDAMVGSPTQAQFDELIDAVRPVARKGAVT